MERESKKFECYIIWNNRSGKYLLQLEKESHDKYKRLNLKTREDMEVTKEYVEMLTEPRLK